MFDLRAYTLSTLLLYHKQRDTYKVKGCSGTEFVATIHRWFHNAKKPWWIHQRRQRATRHWVWFFLLQFARCGRRYIHEQRIAKLFVRTLEHELRVRYVSLTILNEGQCHTH